MGRKRLITSILLSLTILILFQFLYFRFQPIEVKFLVEGNHPADIKVFYASGKESFTKKRSVSSYVNMPDAQNVSLTLPVRKVKKLRIFFGHDTGDIKFGNLEILGKKKTVTADLNKVILHCFDKEKSENGLLNLKMKCMEPYVEFSDTVLMRNNLGFDFKAFVIIATLAFLFSYKIIEYLSKFKILEDNSRIDIVFICLFFAVLFLPMSDISDKLYSDQENRILAVKEKLIKNNKINKEFGKNFDAWFNDHFRWREEVITFYNKAYCVLNGKCKSAKAFEGKDRWYFDAGVFEHWQYSDEEIKQMAGSVRRLKEFCKEKGILCYMVVAPTKAEFAKEKYLKKSAETFSDSFKPVAQYIKTNVNFNLVYPLDEMAEANKKDFVFFKTDHHWTDWGAYTAYKAFMKKLGEKYAGISPLPEERFNIFYDNLVRAEYDRVFWYGYTCKKLNLDYDSCKLEDRYRYYSLKDGKKIRVTWDYGIQKKKFYNPDGVRKKVLVIGNSFAETFSVFLSGNFEKILKLRCNNGESNLKLHRWYKDIDEFKPDIMVFVFESEFAKELKFMFEE